MKLYTIGYGNNKPDDFIARLKANDISHVFDVRRKDSRSWCSSYAHGHPMRSLLAKHNIEYIELDYLANHYDTLDGYKAWLNSIYGAREIRIALRVLMGLKGTAGEMFTPCLLCAELDPEKCHRKIVAEALSSEFKQEWEVVHL